MAPMDDLDLTKLLNKLKDQAEREMAEMIGAELYKSETGFTQDQLYTYCGREDCVCTLILKKDSESYQEYGEMITVCFVYTLKERKSLEQNVYTLNEKPYANAKLLVPKYSQEVTDKLLKIGVCPKDIVSMTVLPSVDENNTFPSKEKRLPKVMEILFEAEGGGQDIYWMYGFLSKLKEEKVGLMPDDEAAYLAYKLVLEKEKLTDEEKRTIFDNDGRICNNTVSYYYLLWRNDAGILKDEQKEILRKLKLNQLYERTALVDQALKDIGLSIEKFSKNYPKQAGFLFEKMLNFHDVSFNSTGKFPLYMNFKSFLHIYFRHTEELNVSNHFADRDKFQLEERDIITVMNIVLGQLNDEYQAYKERNPEGRFYRRGKMAYYYNGDYYNVDVNPDGSINTFYKGTGQR